MASMQAERREVHAEDDTRSSAIDDIAKAREEREHKHEHEHEQKENDGSIIRSVVGAVKSTLGGANDTMADEKMSDTEEKLDETAEAAPAAENEDDEDKDYYTSQFVCT